LAALVRVANQGAAYGPGSPSTADLFFKDCDPDKFIASLSTVLKQEPVELRAFIYNLYYDPWGRYLNPEAREKALALSTLDSAATTPERAGQRTQRHLRLPPVRSRDDAADRFDLRVNARRRDLISYQHG
jgi:hypothetical protein